MHRQTGFALLNSPTPAETGVIPSSGLLYSPAGGNVIRPGSSSVELVYMWLDGSAIWASGTDRGTISIGLWSADTSVAVSTLPVINDSAATVNLISSRPVTIDLPGPASTLGIYISAIVDPVDVAADGFVVFAREGL